MPDTTAAARQRLHRQREREGRWVVQIEIWTDLIDALEIAGFAPAAGIGRDVGIETREDAAAAITAVLLRWESWMDRLRPAGVGVTCFGGNDETVVDTSNHDPDNNP